MRVWSVEAVMERLPPRARAAVRVASAASGPVLFVGGVAWDALTLGRIDAWLDNLILGSYLVGLGVALVWEHRAARGRLPGPIARLGWLARLAVHFLLGGLLSAYVVYYSQSAATAVTWLWLAAIVALMVVNEFLQEWLGTTFLRLVLYLLCAFSFLLFWLPVATGVLDRGMTLVAAVGAVTATGLVLAAMDWRPGHTAAVAARGWRAVVVRADAAGQPLPGRIDGAVRALVERVRGPRPEPSAPADPTDPKISRLRRDPVARLLWQLRPAARYSGYAASWGGGLLVVLTLDLAGVIPPVPLSTLTMGVYRDVRLSGGRATLVYERPRWWAPWRIEERPFRLRPVDRVCVFAPVYAPRGTAPRLYHRWERWDPEEGAWVWTRDRGTWVAATGGREHGSMHYTCKRNNLAPGLWRVSVELPDRRVVGRKRFTLVEGPPEPPDLVERTWP